MSCATSVQGGIESIILSAHAESIILSAPPAKSMILSARAESIIHSAGGAKQQSTISCSGKCGNNGGSRGDSGGGNGFDVGSGNDDCSDIGNGNSNVDGDSSNNDRAESIMLSAGYSQPRQASKAALRVSYSQAVISLT